MELTMEQIADYLERLHEKIDTLDDAVSEIRDDLYHPAKPTLVNEPRLVYTHMEGDVSPYLCPRCEFFGRADKDGQDGICCNGGIPRAVRELYIECDNYDPRTFGGRSF